MVSTPMSVLIVSTGLIQNEDEEVVDLVRQLTESYISRLNTIILTTIPMSGKLNSLHYPGMFLIIMYLFRRYAKPAIRKTGETR